MSTISSTGIGSGLDIDSLVSKLVAAERAAGQTRIDNKKTRLTEYDSPRSGGLIAVNLRDGDELVSAGLASNEDDLMLVSRRAQSVRFHANDSILRPMGRATSGVTGMKFRPGDSLLSMSVIEAGTDPDLFVVFENGVAKRTAASQWTPKGRGIYGVTAANRVAISRYQTRAASETSSPLLSSLSSGCTGISSGILPRRWCTPPCAIR